MPERIRIWEVDSNNQLQEVQRSRLDLEIRIEEWIEQDISILSEDLLIIGRQVRTVYGQFVDLLCIDGNGDLVIVELKRNQTPREVTAQVLDYASWIKELSLEQIIEIANPYLQNKTGQNLELAFQKKFGKELPEILNNNHKMLIVASEIDSSSERIINYLSQAYGVDINAVKFQYFQGQHGQELIARMFLIEPERLEQNVQEKAFSKRKPNLTYEELQAIADQNGVGSLYRYFVDSLFKSYFTRADPTRNSLAFKKEGRTIFSLWPTSSSSETGLKFQVYTERFCQSFDISLDQLKSLLPQNAEERQLQSDPSPEWLGYEGYFKYQSEIDHFLNRTRVLE